MAVQSAGKDPSAVNSSRSVRLAIRSTAGIVVVPLESMGTVVVSNFASFISAYLIAWYVRGIQY